MVRRFICGATQIVGREREQRTSHREAFVVTKFCPRPVNSTVMWHHYSQGGLSAVQYLTYLLVGALYFWIFGAMVRAAGNSFVALGAVFVPLVLGGYASALSLFMPRAAAIVAMTCAVPYLLLGIPGLFRGVIQGSPAIVVTSAAVMGVSAVAFFWREGSVWGRSKTRSSKVAKAVVAALPALFATWWFGTFLVALLSYLHRAT